ncbi:MAG: tRNA (N(6)-L-threonylcarbamoyladenosine(37)-C(2))-methylthiotransferase MtaB [Acutalibacteraceae bacterium]
MNAYFYTLGCKVNQYETQAMMALMRRHGYVTASYHTGDIGDALLVVNSCTVTGESDRKLRQLLRRLRRDNPCAVLVLTGCMPQAFPEAAQSLEEADIVLGNAARHTLPERVKQHLVTGQRIVDIPPHGKAIEPLAVEDFDERTRAFVKIEDGCNRFCSYCIIPYARGRVRSKPPRALKEELEGLVEHGYREAVLVGINLTSYGQDIGCTLADAAEIACAVEGLSRVRLGSLEPDYMTDSLIAQLKALPKLCPQFHVALQSGCDETLRRMNRRYTTAQFEEVCEKLREAFPDCTLTTDVMVGFPGETPEEFEQSLRFVTHIGFAKVHVFPYSRREGTRAACAPDQISAAEKAARARTMNDACEQARQALLHRFVGRTVQVLAETRTKDGGSIGYTREYLPCRLDGAAAAGETVTARVYAVEGDTLFARADSGKADPLKNG